jgi:stearoyl-CoA desaturase (delta-9 desaturase)
LWLALITMGEGWPNNHHHHMGSARQGFFPGEIDLSYGILCGLEKLGLVWDLKQPPARVLEEGRALDAARRSARSA